jgi:hypothetical protein
MAGFNLNSGGVLSKLANTGFGKFITRNGVLFTGVSRLIITSTPDISFINGISQSNIGNKSGVPANNISSVNDIEF